MLQMRTTSGRTGRHRTGSLGARIGQHPGVKNEPGIFLEISVDQLKVDTTYQRPAKGIRIDAMSKDWSWVSCGVLTVILRGPDSDNFYVIDGQHRLEAAKRCGIAALPCIVFDGIAMEEEAKEFIDVNTIRQGISILDRYRALLITNDPVALRTKQLLKEANREPNAVPTKDTVKCLDYLMRTVETDNATLTKIWPTVISLCNGKTIPKILIQGLVYIEKNLYGASITDRKLQSRIMSVGYETIIKSINETCQFEGRTGGAIYAKGILRAINKGRRNKVSIDTTDSTSTTSPVSLTY